MNIKEKILPACIFFGLIILYWYLGIFQLEINIIIKLLPFIILNLYLLLKKEK